MAENLFGFSAETKAIIGAAGKKIAVIGSGPAGMAASQQLARSGHNVHLFEKNNYLGYYELEDVVRFLHETPFLKEEGGILVVEKDVTQISFSQISQIVESNNGKILGIFISNISNVKAEITVKISQSDMNEIIQTFRRHEYEIISEHQEDSYLNSLKERSDYLDKYLNI